MSDQGCAEPHVMVAAKMLLWSFSLNCITYLFSIQYTKFLLSQQFYTRVSQKFFLFPSQVHSFVCSTKYLGLLFVLKFTILLVCQMLFSTLTFSKLEQCFLFVFKLLLFLYMYVYTYKVITYVSPDKPLGEKCVSNHCNLSFLVSLTF